MFSRDIAHEHHQRAKRSLSQAFAFERAQWIEHYRSPRIGPKGFALCGFIGISLALVLAYC